MWSLNMVVVGLIVCGQAALSDLEKLGLRIEEGKGWRPRQIDHTYVSYILLSHPFYYRVVFIFTYPQEQRVAIFVSDPFPRIRRLLTRMNFGRSTSANSYTHVFMAL